MRRSSDLAQQLVAQDDAHAKGCQTVASVAKQMHAFECVCELKIEHKLKTTAVHDLHS